MRLAIALLALAPFAGGCDQLFQVDEGPPRDAALHSDGIAGPDAPIPVDVAAADDEDGDGFVDEVDLCPSDANATTPQPDSDGDGIGDACDPSMITKQTRVFFDPFVKFDTSIWMVGANSWSEVGDSTGEISSEGGAAYAARSVSLSGTAEVWVGDAAAYPPGTVWGVFFPQEVDQDPSLASSTGCELQRQGSGNDHLLLARDDGASVDTGPVAGTPSPVGVRIIATVDSLRSTITCTVSTPGGMLTSSVGFKTPGTQLALYANNAGVQFDSVFYMTSP